METSQQKTNNHKKLIAWYGFTIFLSSAVLLVLEIVAGRIIAPYVGVSIYSWTSIIGVILAGLSIGNWFGGRWADNGGGEKAVGIVLICAGLFSIASLLILTIVAPVLQQSQLDLISSSFFYVLTMFFVPAILLGIVTPILTTIALHMDKRTGHIVGRMHALAAMGSILGTFVTGYWLVQFFGTRSVVIGAAVCLFLLALPYLRAQSNQARAGLIVVMIGTTLVTWARDGFSNPCQWESQYFCLRVDDASNAQYGPARALVLDHLMHGINSEKDPGLLISPYVHLMDELVQVHFAANADSGLSYFFAGGGAYTQPRAVRSLYPKSNITVAELDPKVTDVVQQELFVDITNMQIIHMDARAALQLSQKKHDVIVTDVFHDISVPYHMVTLEFAQLAKKNMSADGLYLVNIVDAYPDPKLTKSLFKTLKNEFQYVDVWLDRPPEDSGRVTYVVSATNNKPFPSAITSSYGFDREWLSINQLFKTTGTAMNNLPILTDDFVPVERLLSSLLFGKAGL